MESRLTAPRAPADVRGETEPPSKRRRRDGACTSTTDGGGVDGESNIPQSLPIRDDGADTQMSNESSAANNVMHTATANTNLEITSCDLMLPLKRT